MGGLCFGGLGIKGLHFSCLSGKLCTMSLVTAPPTAHDTISATTITVDPSVTAVMLIMTANHDHDCNDHDDAVDAA